MVELGNEKKNNVFVQKQYEFDFECVFWERMESETKKAEIKFEISLIKSKLLFPFRSVSNSV